MLQISPMICQVHCLEGIQRLRRRDGERNLQRRNTTTTGTSPPFLLTCASSVIKCYQTPCMSVCVHSFRVAQSISLQASVTAFTLIMALFCFCVPHQKRWFRWFKVKLAQSSMSWEVTGNIHITSTTFRLLSFCPLVSWLFLKIHSTGLALVRHSIFMCKDEDQQS